jgi:protein-L-isoaspartate(D-aspartate) O-methyltransferase
MDLVEARNRMVDSQVRTSDVTDPRIIAAMLELKRELFVPQGRAALAYSDIEMPVRPGAGDTPARRLLTPRVLAKLIQAADVRADDRVLVVGCATGYGAAVVARLAAEVVALEEDKVLAAHAVKALPAAGVRNASIVVGPLAQGWPALSPCDVIIIEGATEVAPRAAFGQLADGGRLVVIEGRGPSGKAMVYRAAGGVVSGRSVFDAAAPVLPGFAAVPAFVF